MERLFENFIKKIAQTDIGNVGETFFANQLRKRHQMNLSETSDFLIDEKYIFEVELLGIG